MRYSQLLIPTQKEIPTGVDNESMKIMVKAGMIKKVSSGLYTHLPYYVMMMRNVADIIREEMNALGMSECKFPILVAQEDLETTNRWNAYGKEMFKLIDRNNKGYALSPTNEEAACTIAKSNINSYRDFPFSIYQIQQKHRDEIRPRGGVIRGREFMMKDAYSFHADKEEFSKYFGAVREAYIKTFNRLGLKVSAVKADSGSIGGDTSEEIMAISSEGETEIAFCKYCGYSANLETVPCTIKNKLPVSSLSKNYKEVHTPDTWTIVKVADFLKLKTSDIAKSLVYNADGKLVVVLIRGDRELNEVKLKNYLGASQLEMATDKEIEKIGSVLGYVGPMGLKKGTKIVADYELCDMQNFVTGANKRDYHIINTNNKDFDCQYADLRFASEEDKCPVCGMDISIEMGTELGHIFDLGFRYTKDYELTYTTKDGEEKLAYMGCYGIGLDRIIASIIDEHHDEKGMLLPLNVAPFKVNVIMVDKNKPEQKNLAEKIYSDLRASGISCLLDDRDMRAGGKFADHELLGIPVRITVGKFASDGKVEVQLYRESAEIVPQKDVLSMITKLVAKGQ